MYRLIHCVLAVAVLCAMSVVAHADAIPLLKNVTTDTVVFTDDFESSTVGQKPGNPWTGGLYGGSENSVLVTADYASEGVPAYQGEKYVKLYRPDESGGAYLQGIGVNSGDGDTIRLEIAFRISGTECSLYATSGSGGTGIAQFGMFGNGDVSVVTPDGNDWDILTQKANVDAWNTLVITHVNGVDAWSVSVNGASFETRQGTTGQSALAFDGITLQTDNRNSTGYWDAVPEPMTMSFLTVGGLGILLRRRK
jgi:hypothetical protein